MWAKKSSLRLKFRHVDFQTWFDVENHDENHVESHDENHVESHDKNHFKMYIITYIFSNWHYATRKTMFIIVVFLSKWKK